MPTKRNLRRFAKRRTQRLRKNTQNGGAVSKIPGIPDPTKEWDWEIKYLGGHGSLTGNVFLVPKDTYILNFATAGRSCEKAGYGRDNWLFADAADADARKKDLQNALFTGTFLSSNPDTEFLYNATDPTGNVNEIYTMEAVNKTKLKERTIAFYEPGDIMADNSISIYNSSLPYFVIGLYDFPISSTFRQELFDRSRAHGSLTAAAKVNAFKSDNIIPKHSKDSELNADHLHFLNRPENLLQNQMFDAAGKSIKRNFLLSEIVELMGDVPAGKKRILFVKACRPADSPAKTERMRRLSIASRERFPMAAPVVSGSTAASGGGGAKPGGAASSVGNTSTAVAVATTNIAIPKARQRFRIQLLETFLSRTSDSYKTKKGTITSVFKKSSIEKGLDDLQKAITELKMGKPVDADELVDAVGRLHELEPGLLKTLHPILKP